MYIHTYVITGPYVLDRIELYVLRMILGYREYIY